MKVNVEVQYMPSDSKKPKISIICVGENHFDPASKLSILAAIEKLHEQQIPIVYCAEKPFDSNLIEQYTHLNIVIDGLDEIIKKYHVEDFFIKPDGQPYPYFDETNRENLIRRLSPLVEGMEGVNAIQVAEILIRLNSDRAERAILSYLIANNVLYAPIDIDKRQRDKLLQSFDKEDSSDQTQLKIVHSWEENRITTMTKNIENAMKSLENTGGIIFCNVGSLHAQRLAAHLFSKYETKVTALYCYSDYCTDLCEQMHSDNMKFDSVNTIKLYEQIPLIPLHFKFNDKNELVTSPRFDQIIAAHLRFIKDSNQLDLKQALKYSGAIALFGIFCFKLFSTQGTFEINATP